MHAGSPLNAMLPLNHGGIHAMAGQQPSPSKKKRNRNRNRRSAGMDAPNNAPMNEQNAKGPVPPQLASRTPLDVSQPSDAVLDRLAARGIFPLKNRSAQNPKALYYCRLCSYHCDNVERAEQHAKGTRHIMKENNRDMRDFLCYIPEPVDFHLLHLSDACLPAEAKTCCIGQDEMQRRIHVFQDIKKHLEETPGLSPHLRLTLFGSMVNGFTLPTSDVNIDVIDTLDRRQLLGRFLLNSYEALRQYNNKTKRFLSVQEHFMGSYPYFNAVDSNSVVYKFSVNNSYCLETNRLTRVYQEMDERCLHLGILFRRLGQLSHMDNQEIGTFPAHAFPLMVIHYLQQTKPPVLPVLQDLTKRSDIPHSAITKIAVDGHVLDYVHEPKKYWSSKNEQTLGELWLGLLRYYAIEFNYETNVISVTNTNVMKKSVKAWKHRRVSIEDPMCPKRDLGRSLGLNDVMDYVLLQLRTAYRYFAVPQTEQGPLFRYVKRRAVDTPNGQPGTVKKRLQLTPLFNPAADMTRIATCLVDEMRRNGQLTIPLANGDGSRQHGISIMLQKLGDQILHHLGADTTTAGLNVVLPNWEVDRPLGEEELVKEFVGITADVLDSIAKCYLKNDVWEVKVKSLRNQLRRGLIRGGQRCAKGQESQEKPCEMPDAAPGEGSVEKVAELLVEQILAAALQSVLEEESGVMQVDGGEEKPGSEAVAEDESPVGNGEVAVRSDDAEDNDDEELEEEEEEENEEEREENEEDDEEEDEDDEDDDMGRVDSASKSSPDGALQAGGSGPGNGVPMLPGGVEECDAPGYLNTNLYRSLSADRLSFVFGCPTMLGELKPPELRCGSCNRSGHLRDNCPDDEIDFRSVKLPQLNNYDLGLLTNILQQVPNDFMETDAHRQQRCNMLNDISQALKKTPYASARLEMFGSCVNGFGFHTSDVDICMTFQDEDGRPKEFTDKEVREIVVEISKIMKKSKRFYPCRAIAQAKVPIVKFSHKPSLHEGDLSLNNRLALQNTKLLLAYHNMDSRVKTLGFVIKILAKLCGIGDASRGSLSSYAYIILMLHYLMREGVIPCLQEMYPPGQPKPVLTIEGWDAWFMDDMQYVYSHWKPQNRDPVGKLWLGFLTYYTQTFDWRQHVVTIKQTKPLHRLEKLWTQAHIAIEDPFDLNHNLGCGLSKKMATYIQRVLFKAAIHFSSQMPNIPAQRFKDYLFDPKKLTGPLGPAPRDRCCKVCGVVGHIARECPTNRRRNKSFNADANDAPDDMELGLGDEENMEEDIDEDEEEDEDVAGEEETPEDSPTSPGKKSATDTPNNAMEGFHDAQPPWARQRASSQSSGPVAPPGLQSSPQTPGKAVAGQQMAMPTSIQAQLMYPSPGAVMGPPPPPLVYVPTSVNAPNSQMPISVRPVMMTVDNRDVAVPLATAPTPEMLLQHYYNLLNANGAQHPGLVPNYGLFYCPQPGHALPRLELEPNQDPCVLGFGPVASSPNMPAMGPPSSTTPGNSGRSGWPRLPQQHQQHQHQQHQSPHQHHQSHQQAHQQQHQASPQQPPANQSFPPGFHHPQHHHQQQQQATPPQQQQQQQQQQSRQIMKGSHNNYQNRVPPAVAADNQGRAAFHPGMPPGGRSRGSPSQQGQQNASYSRAVAREFQGYPDSGQPSHNHLPSTPNSHAYGNRGGHGGPPSFGMHHRHGYRSSSGPQQSQHPQQHQQHSVPTVQQRRPTQQQQQQQQQYNHPGAPPGHSPAQYKNMGPKRRG